MNTSFQHTEVSVVLCDRHETDNPAEEGLKFKEGKKMQKQQTVYNKYYGLPA